MTAVVTFGKTPMQDCVITDYCSPPVVNPHLSEPLAINFMQGPGMSKSTKSLAQLRNEIVKTTSALTTAELAAVRADSLLGFDKTAKMYKRLWGLVR
jgi:hypothetical protein